MLNRYIGVPETLVILLVLALMFALAWIRALLEERKRH